MADNNQSAQRIARLERRVTLLTLVSVVSLAAAVVLGVLVLRAPPDTGEQLRFEQGQSFVEISALGIKLGRVGGSTSELNAKSLTLRDSKKHIELRNDADTLRVRLTGSRGNVAAELINDVEGSRLELRGKSENVAMAAENGVAAVRAFNRKGEEASITSGAANRPVLFLEALDGGRTLARAGEAIQLTSGNPGGPSTGEEAGDAPTPGAAPDRSTTKPAKKSARKSAKQADEQPGTPDEKSKSNPFSLVD